MVTMCFVGKTPSPTARVFGLGDVGIPLDKFEQAVVGLSGLPDELMSAGKLDPADRFQMIARRELSPGQIWTWIGEYQCVKDNGGRAGAYLGSGVLLLNQTADGDAILDVVDDVTATATREILSNGRIRDGLSTLAFTPGNPESSVRVDQLVRPLAGNSGLSPNAGSTLYCYADVDSRNTYGKLIDLAQVSWDFSVYDSLIFNPSHSFGEKLNENQRIVHAILRASGALELSQVADVESPTRSRPVTAPQSSSGYPTQQDEYSAPPPDTSVAERRLIRIADIAEKEMQQSVDLYLSARRIFGNIVIVLIFLLAIEAGIFLVLGAKWQEHVISAVKETLEADAAEGRGDRTSTIAGIPPLASASPAPAGGGDGGAGLSTDLQQVRAQVSTLKQQVADLTRERDTFKHKLNTATSQLAVLRHSISSAGNKDPNRIP